MHFEKSGLFSRFYKIDNFFRKSVHFCSSRVLVGVQEIPKIWLLLIPIGFSENSGKFRKILSREISRILWTSRNFGKFREILEILEISGNFGKFWKLGKIFPVPEENSDIFDTFPKMQAWFLRNVTVLWNVSKMSEFSAGAGNIFPEFPEFPEISRNFPKFPEFPEISRISRNSQNSGNLAGQNFPKFSNIFGKAYRYKQKSNFEDFLYTH